jgi:hypothetical protein
VTGPSEKRPLKSEIAKRPRLTTRERSGELPPLDGAEASATSYEIPSKTALKKSAVGVPSDPGSSYISPVLKASVKVFKGIDWKPILGSKLASSYEKLPVPTAFGAVVKLAGTVNEKPLLIMTAWAELAPKVMKLRAAPAAVKRANLEKLLAILLVSR